MLVVATKTTRGSVMSYPSFLQQVFLFVLFCLLAVGYLCMQALCCAVCLVLVNYTIFSLQVTIFEGGEEDKKLSIL